MHSALPPGQQLIAEFPRFAVVSFAKRGLRNEGVRLQVSGLTDEPAFAILRCADGYRTALPLADLLVPDVLIVDRLNDQPLTVEHGAPIRLVAPAHYGYKSAKHLVGIELRHDDTGYRPLLPRLLDHPRARVALEERGQLLPGWVLRYAFRPFVQPIIRKLKRLTAD